MRKLVRRSTRAHATLPVQIEPEDPAKRRWFLVSLAITLSVAVGGWIYFFVGQMTSIAAYVPATVTSPFVTSLVNAAGNLTAQSATELKQATPAAVPILTQVKSQAETTVTLGAVLNSLKTQLSK